MIWAFINSDWIFISYIISGNHFLILSVFSVFNFNLVNFYPDNYYLFSSAYFVHENPFLFLRVKYEDFVLKSFFPSMDI